MNERVQANRLPNSTAGYSVELIVPKILSIIQCMYSKIEMKILYIS